MILTKEMAPLTFAQHERGNMTRLRMHMFSLKRMVLLRGGLQGIRESNPMVANLIFWYVICATTSSYSSLKRKGHSPSLSMRYHSHHSIPFYRDSFPDNKSSIHHSPIFPRYLHTQYVYLLLQSIFQSRSMIF